MYRDLASYITQRLAAMAERLGWGAAYLHNLINGQFRPSRKRCIEIAEDFGDDPNIILALAGFYVPPDDDHEAHLTLLNSLTPGSRMEALDYLQYLKWKEDRQG